MSIATDKNPLGQTTVYSSTYDASLLFPIARADSRKVLGLGDSLPFFGSDVWTAYEVSWLNLSGKPIVGVAEFIIPSNSHHIIESKSLKLYLNSFNQTAFAGLVDVQKVIARDLSMVAGEVVEVQLALLQDSSLLIDNLYSAQCLDDLDVAISSYHPDAQLLVVSEKIVQQERLCSHLLKTNCPVTGQPDWASIFITYSGKALERDALLKYIISFREHQDFHEHCVERIFVDILSRCKPTELTVYARYTRRGGLDINPFRSTDKDALPQVGRLLRQ